MMIDLNLCHRPASEWFALKLNIANWLMTPALVLLPLFGMISLPWLTPKLPGRWQVSSLGTILLTIYLAAQLPLTINLASLALEAFLPADLGTSAEAIVVLGRGERLRDERVKVVNQLWQDHRAPVIFASGAGDALPIMQLLQGAGIPTQAIAGEYCSRTTEENAQFTAMELQPQGVKRIVLVTDPPHMWRSLLTFRSFGFEVVAHPSPLPLDLTLQDKGMLLLYEYVGLISYGLKGRFLPQVLPNEYGIRHHYSGKHRTEAMTAHFYNIVQVQSGQT